MNKDEYLAIRMDKKLLNQLTRYANRKDGGMVSKSARKAIALFLEENGYKVNK